MAKDMLAIVGIGLEQEGVSRKVSWALLFQQ